MKAACSLAMAALLAISLATPRASAASPDSETLASLARDAVFGDCTRSRLTAIGQLRSAGPAGLEALFTVHAAAIEAHRNNPQAEVEHWSRISTALNEVAAQHDAHASRLYWYTDLEQAKAAAKQLGKPILSLRMLGKLTEECSCANSRFFRTTLYANQQVSKVLREQFVLHWKSVRPVPKVTIDFGDGRRLERTLTGNSIHYVLDAEGRPIEAIPGLYGPQAFLQQVENGRVLVAMVAAAGSNAEVVLKNTHAQRRHQAIAAWLADLERLGVSVPAGEAGAQATPGGPNGGATPGGAQAQARAGARGPFPTAAAAARLTVTKSGIEDRLIAEVTRRNVLAASTSRSTLEKATTDEAWQRIAALHAEEARLDDSTVLLIREHNPPALRSSEVTVTKRLVESPLLRMVRNLQGSIALDAVKNEYLYHTRIHEWFAAGEPVAQDVEELNKRIYAELFLTPDADPWLGLLDETVYTGIRDSGVRR
jgi:hypothetical protein